jgi:hypothetical protein
MIKRRGADFRKHNRRDQLGAVALCPFAAPPPGHSRVCEVPPRAHRSGNCNPGSGVLLQFLLGANCNKEGERAHQGCSSSASELRPRRLSPKRK